MVSVVSLIAIIVTFLICSVAPIVALIIYAVKNKGKGVWLAWIIGAAGFVVMQMIIRTPILSLLSVAFNDGFMKLINEHYVLYVFILAFSAALFEVVARVGGALILRKKACYEVAFGAGLGHGGIEAMLLIGSTYLNNLLYSIMINTGAYDEIISTSAQMGADTASLYVIKDQLIGTSPVLFYMAGYERILTMILHVTMTVLVFYFIYKKKTAIGIILCLFIHTLIDFIPGFLTSILPKTIDAIGEYIIIYAFLTVMAIVGIIILVVIKKKWKK